MHALIIEDDPSVSRSIELILKAQGHICDTASSGGAGLDLAQSKEHDIILLDLTLPDMDGHRVLRRLRAAKVRTPVLILSGSDDRDDKVKGLGTGADDYVTKPFDKDELLARMRAIIRRATGRTPPVKAAALDGALLARRGQASPWSFTDSYTPPQSAETRKAADRPAATVIGLGSLSPVGAGDAPSAQFAPIPGAASGRVIVIGNPKGAPASRPSPCT